MRLHTLKFSIPMHAHLSTPIHHFQRSFAVHGLLLPWPKAHDLHRTLLQALGLLRRQQNRPTEPEWLRRPPRSRDAVHRRRLAKAGDEEAWRVRTVRRGGPVRVCRRRCEAKEEMTNDREDKR